MTVDELIIELEILSDAGHGDDQVEVSIEDAGFMQVGFAGDPIVVEAKDRVDPRHGRAVRIPG